MFKQALDECRASQVRLDPALKLILKLWRLAELLCGLLLFHQ